MKKTFKKTFINTSFTIAIMLCFLVIATACATRQIDTKPKPATNTTNSTQNIDLTGYIECTNPRPEICTMEYNPVCAKTDTGIRCKQAPCPSEEWKTYATGCTACGNSKVYGYVPKACPGDQQNDTNPIDINPTGANVGGNCNSDQDCISGLVCCYPCGVEGCHNKCKPADATGGCGPAIP